MFPFDAEVLTSFYGGYNAAVWPAQVAALVLALAAVWLSLSPRRFGARAIGLILAAGWLWCGLVFFLQHFAAYDFMAPLYGGAFVIEAALLLWFLVVRQHPPASQPGGFGAAGLILAFLAIIGLPLISGLGAAGFAAAPIVGLAPGPTVLMTCALLLLAEGRPPRVLLLIPVLWCGVAAVTGWVLVHMTVLAGAVMLAVALALLLWKQRRSG